MPPCGYWRAAPGLHLLTITWRAPSMRKLLLASTALLLSACAVGPDYQRPHATAPAAYLRAEQPLFSSRQPEGEFWRRFEDPLLAQLVEDALLANNDLRIALSRYDRAQALLRGSKADRLPTVSATAEAGYQQLSADQLPGASRRDREGDSYAASVNVLWEPDLFGRVRRSVQAQRAEADAVTADLAALQVVVVAELVAGYFELRGLQEQLRVARANAAIQQDSLNLVERQLAAGRGTPLDVSRARAQLEATLSRIPTLEGEVGATTHRLSVLTGREPTALAADLEAAPPLPALPASIATGLPAELLRRRPDIIAAERRLEAATARVGIATADLYPRFALAGLLGTQAADLGDLFSRNSETRMIALGIDWTFLQVGQTRARIAATKADVDASIARHRQAVLLALEETETALIRYARAQRERAHLQVAASAAAEASRLARQRYELGVIDFLQVIDAERARLETENRLAISHTRSATQLVALYKALAGGWPERAGVKVAGRTSSTADQCSYRSKEYPDVSPDPVICAHQSSH
jgi:multidrug efflux system outer membrane protein